MRIWVTGSAGFLGSHLCDELSELGHDVKGNDNLLCSPSPEIYGFYGYREDCRNFAKMKSMLLGNQPEVVVHCAATAHEGLSNFSPSFIVKNIYEASVSTFSAAIAAGVKRIVFMSSMARYGRGTIADESVDLNQLNHPLPFKEYYSPMPIDPYGIAKVAAEDTLKALCRLHNVEYVIAVPHNIIGPRQKYDDPYRNVASIMINRALQKKPLIIYGDGKQKRCFSPIADCLDSLVKMVDAPVAGRTINIGPDSGEITILELAETIRDLTGGNSEIQHVPARPNEVREAYCSSDKARKLLGYEPKQSIRDCLAEMVLYIKEHGTKPFKYSFPIEITKGCPETWLNQTL